MAPRTTPFQPPVPFEDLPAGVFVGTLSLSSLAVVDATSTVNPFLRRLFGFPADLPVAELRPFGPERFLDPDARARLLNRCAAVGQVSDHLLRMRTVDGAAVWVEISASARPAGEAGRWHIEALVRDVTERQRLDEQSRSVHRQLLHADRMAALGQTVSGVAHELNNPLATVLSWAQRLGERTTDETTRRGAAVIAGEAERAARIVRNLLTFSRERQSTRSVVDLNEVVRDTLRLRTRDQHGAPLTVREALTPNLPTVFADAHQLQQILLNLVINAEQALGPGNGNASIVVRTGCDAERARVSLEVEDNGPGVPAAVRDRIFDPFFTTKEVGQGTGLGLSVVYAIVQEHGGHIQLEDVPGGGARFRVELPVAGLQAQPTARTAAPSGGGGAQAAILVVEDEQALAAAVVEALADAGFTVTYAPDGERALARLQERRYDLMICDITMPRLDGMGLYRAMQAAPGVVAPPVIFVTGEVERAEVERFLADSGCRWMAKPFRLAELLTMVRDELA